MKTIDIKRLAYNDDGTPGILSIDDYYCYTYELPWVGNQPNISCIPEGMYSAKKIISPKRGYLVIQLINVPGRTFIQIHIGNSAKDIKGCILPGTVGEDCRVGNSTEAFNDIMKITEEEDILIKINSI